ncbi:MAG TPA: hypothetical protein VMW24_19695 [Sedimentisphaerales bacterium]|nr:hypothetical protein [Sedimentisphaerales bacterium]
MKSPITKLATAAIVAIACFIGLSLWRGTESGIALADVLARVEQVKSFRCKGSVTVNSPIAPDKPNQYEVRSIFLLSREHGCKVNAEILDPNGRWLPYVEEYTSDEKKSCVRLAHTEKKYIREEINPEWFETPENQEEDTSDPGYLLKAIMACKYENLGRSIVDGVEVEGFRTTDPNCRSPVSGSWWSNPQVDIKLWVSVKTHLPVRFEDFSSSIDQRGVTHSQRQVMYDVEWDVPVTAAEFYPPPIPEGYAVVDLPRVDSEETAIQGLRRCIELFGNYLESISDDAGATGVIFSAFEKSETPAALRLKEEIKGLTEDEKLDRVTDAGDSIYRLIWLYVGLVQQKKDPAYYGKIVTPKDSDKVLLRWKLSDSEYRVILGDLHAETVSPERLAELEKALSK